MKRRMILVLAACLLLSGCGTELPAGQLPEVPAMAAEVPGDTPEAWREGYQAFLTELCRQEAAVRKIDRPDYDPNDYAGELAVLSSGYCLYDIDGDGVPEMLIEYGNCSAAEYTRVYGWADGAVTELGGFSSGHASLYTWPGENAVAFNWSHMNGRFVDKISIQSGTLAQETVFEETYGGGDETYTDIEDIVPGCMELRPTRTTLGLTFGEEADSSADTPLTLPIDDYGKERTPAEPDPAGDAAARAAIQAVLDGKAALTGVSADGFGGDTGEMLLEDYLAPGGVDRYAEKPMEIVGLAWVDMDRDGRTECLLRLEHGAEDSFSGTTYVILSRQDGRVYAYCCNYCESYEVNGEGAFHHVYADDTFAVSFRGEACYQYTAVWDETVPLAEWEEPA